ncbi:hypothetical protein CW304_29195 [Bacillus sp. UFRGS-B20]|nr:hypothetical protein CW304_29195 [Bacillus sp. UFRGS-B20]
MATLFWLFVTHIRYRKIEIKLIKKIKSTACITGASTPFIPSALTSLGKTPCCNSSCTSHFLPYHKRLVATVCYISCILLLFISGGDEPL